MRRALKPVMAHLPYVVDAPTYSENNGGAMFQHGLVHTLNKLGETAYLSPTKLIYKSPPLKRLKHFISPPPYHLAPGFETPFVSRSVLAKPYMLSILKLCVVTRWGHPMSPVGCFIRREFYTPMSSAPVRCFFVLPACCEKSVIFTSINSQSMC